MSEFFCLYTSRFFSVLINMNILLVRVVLLVVEYELVQENPLVDQYLFHVLMHFVQQFRRLFQH